MKHHFFSLIMGAVVFGSFAAKPAQADSPFFSAESGLAATWSLVPWGGLAASATEINKEFVIQLKRDQEPPDEWAGLSISKWQDPVTLDENTVGKGAISLKINGLKGGGHRLQISVELLDEQNNVVPGTANFIGLSEVADFEVVDDDETTWQNVLIPLKVPLEQSGRSAKEVHFLGKISLQYIGPVSENDLLITEVELKVP